MLLGFETFPVVDIWMIAGSGFVLLGLFSHLWQGSSVALPIGWHARESALKLPMLGSTANTFTDAIPRVVARSF